MGFNVFGGSKESLLAPVVTKEAMEAQSAQSLAQVAKKYSKILSDISQGEAMRAAFLGLAERLLHDFLGDPGNLDVHLHRGDALEGITDRKSVV